MKTWSVILLLICGGSLGTVTRYFLSSWLQCCSVFPCATLLINITGSFVIGICAELFIQSILSEAARIFCMVGFLGAYTTFSTFSLEFVQLCGSGFCSSAFAYLALSNLGGICAAILGVQSMRILLNFLR